MLRITPNQREVLDLLKTDITLQAITLKLGISRAVLNSRVHRMYKLFNLPKKFKRKDFKNRDIEAKLERLQALADEKRHAFVVFTSKNDQVVIDILFGGK